jgi:hypothetical protein
MLWFEERYEAAVPKSRRLRTLLKSQKPWIVCPSRLNQPVRRAIAMPCSSSTATTVPWRVRQISSDSVGAPRTV